MKETFLIIKINGIPNKGKKKRVHQWQTQNHLTCKPQTQTHLIIQ